MKLMKNRNKILMTKVVNNHHPKVIKKKMNRTKRNREMRIKRKEVNKNMGGYRSCRENIR